MGERATEGLDRQSARADAAENQPLLGWVHIPRTGGGTVSTAISKNYSRLRGPGNFQKNPDATRAALRRLAVDVGAWKAVGDHVPYGLLKRHLPDDTRYLTFLREPVDRVLSHYHFHAQKGTPPGRKLKPTWESMLTFDRIEREGTEAAPVRLEDDIELSLEEGLRRRICLYDNFMTRFLWGGDSIFGELPPDALDRAKENLSTFWFVGMTERLDDSLVLLGRELGIGLMPYFRRHVSRKRPPLDGTPNELRELVAAHNALDLELYRFARERFEQSAPSAEELAEEAEELRRLSVAVTAEGEAHRATKRQRRTAKQAAHEAREERRAAVKAERERARQREPRRAAAAQSDASQAAS